MADRKILAVCLSTPNPGYAHAAWLREQLHIVDYVSLPPNRRDLDAALIPVLEKHQRDHQIMIDDASQRLSSRYGIPFRMNAMDNNGKPMIISSLELYKELVYQSAIRYPRANASAFQVPDSIIDEETDPRGNTVFRVEWLSVTTFHILTLLCVQGSVYNAVGTAAYINAMTAATPEGAAASPLDPLRRVVEYQDEVSQVKGSEATSMKGWRIL